MLACLMVYERVPNVYFSAQLQVLCALVLVGGWWRWMRPRVRFPQFAAWSASLTCFGACGQVLDPPLGWFAPFAGGLLLASMLIDLRFHVRAPPAITPAVARVVEAPPPGGVARRA